MTDQKGTYGQSKLSRASHQKRYWRKCVRVCGVWIVCLEGLWKTEANIGFSPYSHIFNPSLSTYFLFFSTLPRPEIDPIGLKHCLSIYHDIKIYCYKKYKRTNNWIKEIFVQWFFYYQKNNEITFWVFYHKDFLKLMPSKVT